MEQCHWETIETSRLRGERLNQGHFDFILQMHQDEQVMQHLGGLRSRYRTRRYLEHNLTHWREHGCGIWVLFDRDTGQALGRGGLRHTELEGTPEVELAYALMPTVWGQGLATEFAEAAVQVGLGPMGLGNVCAVVDPLNEASQQVVEKVGFEYQRDIQYSGRPHRLYRIHSRDHLAAKANEG